jgi:hypothetical protein
MREQKMELIRLASEDTAYIDLDDFTEGEFSLTIPPLKIRLDINYDERIDITGITILTDGFDKLNGTYFTEYLHGKLLDDDYIMEKLGELWREHYDLPTPKRGTLEWRLAYREIEADKQD